MGLGDLDLVMAEKRQPRAGRLDLLLYDEQLDRRYEVELMLGETDPSHIIRCLEYWDIERRRYPAYEHVAVLVAEDITSRFLNVMALLAGSIPLIAIQMVALKINDAVALHFVRVLDQTQLRTDDEYEAEERAGGRSQTDRQYWEHKIGQAALSGCDAVKSLVEQVTGKAHRFHYRRVQIALESTDGETEEVWLRPATTVIRVGGYVRNPEEWVRKFDELGLNATLRRGNKAVLASFPLDEVVSPSTLPREFIDEALKPRENNVD